MLVRRAIPRPVGRRRAQARHEDMWSVQLLIGMPGLERRLARYPQLYSRIGFAHR